MSSETAEKADKTQKTSLEIANLYVTQAVGGNPFSYLAEATAARVLYPIQPEMLLEASARKRAPLDARDLERLERGAFALLVSKWGLAAGVIILLALTGFGGLSPRLWVYGLPILGVLAALWIWGNHLLGRYEYVRQAIIGAVIGAAATAVFGAVREGIKSVSWDTAALTAVFGGWAAWTLFRDSFKRIEKRYEKASKRFDKERQEVNELAALVEEKAKAG